LPDDSPGAGADTPRNGSNGSARSGGGEERTDPRDDPDVERMLRVRAGDDDAFQELFLKHGEPLLNLAYRFVGSRARAEEIVQEAFLRIYRASSRYEPRARFRTYASRVVINLSLNELRRVEHQLVVDPEAGSPPTSTTNVAPREYADPGAVGGEGEVVARDIHRRIEAAIEKLPRSQKTALLLTRFDGYSYRQVAEVLDTTNDAVKALVARATRTLRAELCDLIE
jgi:RNA polymerase sigma-70 factor, ECF subfamily